MHYTTTTTATTIATTTKLHYATLHKLHYTTLQLQLHYLTLHYTRLHYTTLHYTKLQYTTLQYTTLITHGYNYNSTALQLQLQLQLHYTTLHPAVAVRWPLQTMQPLQKTVTQLQPPFGPSVDSLCHPWFTTTNPSCRFPIFETSATALCRTTGIPMKPCFCWPMAYSKPTDFHHQILGHPRALFKGDGPASPLGAVQFVKGVAQHAAWTGTQQPSFGFLYGALPETLPETS